MQVRFASLLGQKMHEENRTISLEEVAAATGVARQSLARWRDGDLGTVRVETLDTLCKYFNCQPGDLLVRVPDKTN